MYRQPDMSSYRDAKLHKKKRRRKMNLPIPLSWHLFSYQTLFFYVWHLFSFLQSDSRINGKIFFWVYCQRYLLTNSKGYRCVLAFVTKLCGLLVIELIEQSNIYNLRQAHKKNRTENNFSTTWKVTWNRRIVLKHDTDGRTGRSLYKEIPKRI